MRLEASEKDIYLLMDRKDRYLAFSSICLVLSIAALYLYLCYKQWDFLFWFVGLLTSAALMVYAVTGLNKKILEMRNCYLELEDRSLVVRQAEAEKFLVSRIYYHEIEKIVEGSERGAPRIYIRIIDREDRDSFIALNETDLGLNLCIKSTGYRLADFKQFYHKLRWQVPGKVLVFGTANQDSWNMKQSRPEMAAIIMVFSLYIILKLIERIIIF